MLQSCPALSLLPHNKSSTGAELVGGFSEACSSKGTCYLLSIQVHKWSESKAIRGKGERESEGCAEIVHLKSSIVAFGV